MPKDAQFKENGEYFGQKQAPFLKNQKITAAGLAVFAVLIIILWITQLRNNIYKPFNSPASEKQIASEEKNSDQELKNKDTDSDGLNDYDELNIYGTSPYLEDTDGDAANDGEETKTGEDPNCPKGKTCSGGLSDNSADSALGGKESPAGVDNGTFSSLLDRFRAADSAENPQAGSDSDQLNILKNIDSASLRQLLLQSGMKKEMLDQISDADLMKSYGEVFSAGTANK